MSTTSRGHLEVIVRASSAKVTRTKNYRVPDRVG
jgi:hypothetical protein